MDLKRLTRKNTELREINFQNKFSPYAEGSCMVKFGNTHIICTASVEERVPIWLKGKQKGWVTAEYGMIPRATHSRVDRDISKGKISGRSQEIQRLIGRSLRSAINLNELGERQIKIDCDVIQADGGTRTAAISGGFVSLCLAIKKLKDNYNLQKPIIKNYIGAVSAGIIENKPLLDLDYSEDSIAQVDANFVICETGDISEIQVTGEEFFFNYNQFTEMFSLAKIGIQEIISKQKEALK